MRLGLIDIGSNTSKAMVVENNSIAGKDGFTVLDQSSLPCRLLSKSAGNTTLSTKQLEKLISSLISFQKFFQKYETDQVFAVATEALRKTDNALTVVSEVKAATSISIRILSGIEEARTVALGLKTDPALHNWSDYFALDLGGGSLEILLIQNSEVLHAHSLPLGAVTVSLASGVDPSGPISLNAEKKVRKYVQNILQNKLPNLPNSPSLLAGSGGTLVFLRKMISMELPSTMDCSSFSLHDVEDFGRKTASIPLEVRAEKYPHLPKDRADIFPFGLFVLAETMKHLGANTITHSYHNLRYGLAQQIFSSMED